MNNDAIVKLVELHQKIEKYKQMYEETRKKILNSWTATPNHNQQKYNFGGTYVTLIEKQQSSGITQKSIADALNTYFSRFDGTHYQILYDRRQHEIEKIIGLISETRIKKKIPTIQISNQQK